MRTVASEIEATEAGDQVHAKARAMPARKSRLRRLALEGLEERTLLSTLPAATTSTLPIDISGSRNNESSPQIAVDRYNPNHMVAVWVNNDPQLPAPTRIIVEAAYSNDGGLNWSSFDPGAPILVDPNASNTSTSPGNHFEQITDPSVGFDAQHRFYILVEEHMGTDASGALVLTKFDFSGTDPQQESFVNPNTGNSLSFNIITEWANSIDPLAHPTMTVDDNQASFTDPASHQTQTDPSANHVFIAWATNTTAPPNTNNFNANTIRLVASGDGGQSFTAPIMLNDNGYFGGQGQQNDTAPRIAVSQGRLPDPAAYGPGDPGVPGGIITTVWDDFNSLATLRPVPEDQIWSATVSSGTAYLFPGATGPVNSSAAGAVTTPFLNPVLITDPMFSLSDLSVTLTINDPNGAQELAATLVSPNGVRVPLFLNQVNTAGTTINANRGVSGNSLGIANSGQNIGTTFNDNAARRIAGQGGAAPYIGTFRPEVGSLTNPFLGQTAAQVSGNWSLEITDERAAGNNGPPQLVSWSITFTSGLTGGRNVPVATTSVRGTYSGNFSRGLPSSPVGVGPAPVITSDNTLGSFSPHQGTLYIAYVNHDDIFDIAGTNANPADNTDIALVTSTDGGQSWQLQSLKVNDDNGLTDGRSGSVVPTDPLDIDGIERGRSQYLPEVTVDQATGTLVMSWRDARNDAGNTRVATYVTTSIDDGQTFSPNAFANAPETITDAITGKTITQGPTPDNESGGAGALADGTFGYGTQMGLAAVNGRLYTAWAGNQNVDDGSTRRTDIFFNSLVSTAGPRVIDSTMGPVGGPDDPLNTQTAPDGTPIPTTIQVTFDRPVDPDGDPNRTFLPSDVEVFFNGLTPGAAPVPLLVTGVSPVVTPGDPNTDGHFGYTTWLITFDATKNADGSDRTAPIDFVGTYSYLIKPEVSDRIRSFQVTQVVEPVINATSSNVPVRIPASGTGGSGTFADNSFSTITLTNHPGQVITGVTVNLSLTHTRDGDLSIFLISPNGTFITLYRNPFDEGQNFTNTTFSDNASQSILEGTAPYTGTFQPGDAFFFGDTELSALNGGPVDGTWFLEFNDDAAQNIGQLTSWSISVRSVAPASQPSLQTGNMMDQNGNGTTAEDATATPVEGELSPGDVYAVPTPAPTVPTNYDLTPGSTTPFPQGPYDPSTLPLIVSGPHVVSTSANSPGAQGTADNLVLNDTVSSLNVTFDRDMDSGSATQGLQSISVTSGGTGYTSAPNVMITGGGGSGAAATATINANGVVTGITLTSEGTGYIATPTVTFMGGGGTGATAAAKVFPALPLQVMGPNGRIDAPRTFTKGGIQGIVVSNPGKNYTTAPTVTITGGGGSGATAVATIFKGAVTGITLTSPGVNYTSVPIVTITGGGGSGATATAQFQTIPVGGNVLNSTINVPSDNGTFPIAHLAVALSISDNTNAPLTGTLIAPDGTKVVLFSGLTGANLTNTVFDESALSPINFGFAPYSGTFRTVSFATTGGLNNFNGKDLSASTGQGNWTLQISGNTTGNPATLVSWSLIATPRLSMTAKGDGSTPGTSRTFTVNFPQQELSGTYTVELGSTAVDTMGHQVDENQNAGIDVLRGQGINNPTTPVTYNASNLPLPIPLARTVGGNTTPGTLASIINVPDSFPIQGIINGKTGLTVQLNITDSSDPTLQAMLVYHPGQPDEVSIPLFANVGNGPNAANFTNTIFDDQSPTPIQNGGAPFFGTFSPQLPLLSPALGSPGLKGLNAQGNWELLIKSTQTTSTGRANTLNSWSLTFQKPLPVSGLGESNTDTIHASFRIFTMDPTNPLSSDTWTAVGPAGINAPVFDDAVTVTESQNLPLTDAGVVPAIAIDPSDPSGNTVYIGSASGGIWKTTNFLNPSGPTWIPLTDFGPTYSLNIGSIAVFPRNHDPRQSIIFASTGDGNTGSQGVGFLRSMDGGATWTLLDSTTNTDASGNVLPINSLLRDHIFVGTTSFKVVVDPTPTPTGGVIVYAALSGDVNAAAGANHGGLWRSQDGGNTWKLMKGGQATDVVLDPASGLGGPNGNLQIVYAGFAGDGVYSSPNQGQVWNIMTGQTGNPLIVDPINQSNVNPVSKPNPNGAANRYVLAKPALTGNPAADKIYEGWLYIAQVGTNNLLTNVFVTKDFGQTWTPVSLPSFVATTDNLIQAVPNYDVSQGNYPISGGGTFAHPPAGSYNISLAVDPTNPAIVYLGGTQFNQTTGLVRIDTTLIADSHNATPFETTRSGDGGALTHPAGNTTATNGQGSFAPLNVLNFRNSTGLFSQANSFNAPFPPNAFINLIRDPASPFLTNSTLDLINGQSFANNGAQVAWIPFDVGGTDVHTIVPTVDPLTGHTRILVGDDQGIFSAVDDHGKFQTSVGTAPLPGGSRNGNLQIAQFYYGAAQPSSIAAQAAQALFYGSSNHNGGPASDANVLSNGNIAWTGVNPLGGFGNWVGPTFTPLGIDLGATGVVTDPQGGKTNPLTGLPEQASYSQFWWPGEGGNYTDFFQVSLNGNTSFSRTFNLLQSANNLPTPDSQWPLEPGSTIAINSINGQQMMVSAPGNNNGVGRIFRTEDQGITWHEIGNPSALDNTYAPALAFGAPDPNGPAGVGNLDNFLYAGTLGGHIFMSQVGGGVNGNAWADISTGLDGSPVEQVVTDPNRGSHDAYAVTQQGVFRINDSVTLANAIAANAAAVAAGNLPPFSAAQLAAFGWQPITGNLFQLVANAFASSSLAGNPLQGVAAPDQIQGSTALPIVQDQLGGLTSIVADWRYAIPANPSLPVSATNPVHPVLYVAGGTGVYRSLDNGTTWAPFPSQGLDNAPQDGGLLPHTQISQISLVLGNIDPNTGRALQQPGDPNILLATTYGRGDFAIRVGPAITPSSVQLDTTLPAPTGSVAGVAQNGGPLVTISQPVIDGFSEESAFGNTVRITLLDLTDPAHPRFIGGYDPSLGFNTPQNPNPTDIPANQTDAFGRFAVQINRGAFSANGVKTIGIQAIDASGTKGNIVSFSFTLNTSDLGQPTPPNPPTLALSPLDDTGVVGDSITSVTRPHLVGVTDANTSVTLLDANGNVVPVIDPATGLAVNSITSDANGAFTLWLATALSGSPATQYSFRAEATNTFGSTFSPFLTLTISTTGPTSNNFTGLDPADDTGVKGDNITTVRAPHFDGTTDPGALVDLINADTNVVLATSTADSNGKYSIQLAQGMTNGTLRLETKVHDAAGNQGPLSSPIAVTLTSVNGDYNVDAATELALFQRTNASMLTWLVNKGATPAGGTVFGQGALDIPFAGDFNGDGVTDLAYYEPSTTTWFLQLSQGTTLASGNIRTVQMQGTASAVPFVGDFDGDGITDVGLYQPGTGSAASTWTIIESVTGLQTFMFGRAGDIPVPGKYDGPGQSELAVYRPSTGQFLIAGAGGTVANPTVITIGVPNEVPVPANYDNQFYFSQASTAQSERTDVAVYDPNTGTFTIGRWTGTSTITTRTDTGPAASPFRAGDIPAPGQYDGTGDAQAAVYRPSTGQFIVNGLTGLTPLGQANGGYIPVLAPYVYRQLPASTTAPTIALAAVDDSGKLGDNVTNVTRPHIVGKADPNVLIDLINTRTGQIIGSGSADGSGNYSVQPTNPLIEGTYTLQARAHGLGGGASFVSPLLTLTIQTSFLVTGTSPSSGTLVTALPNGQIVVNFNHKILGLVPDSPINGFASNPFSVMLIPSGPDGGTQLANHQPLWSAPSGVDKGDLPVPATLVYHENANGTSTVTLTPAFPLPTDVYLISIAGLTDIAGNPVTAPGAALGAVYASFDLHASPASTSALQVVSVTANHGATIISNNRIPQPDTIAIQFNKPVDTWTANVNTVHLFAQGALGFTPVPAAVAYSPSTNSIYLTPEAVLNPGTVYVVSVDGSVTDDTNFPSPGIALGQTFNTTFTVGNGPVSDQGPLTVTATSPANGTQWTSALGYVSATFSEDVNLNSLGRFSAMLVPHTGGVHTGNSGYADVPMNAKVAFNPNTNQLVIVPTQFLGNQVYLIALGSMSATNGNTLQNSPFYSTFQLTGGATAAVAHSVTRSSQSAALVAVASAPATAPATTAVVTPSIAPTAVASPAVAPAHRSRPRQRAHAHDHALGGTAFHIRSLLSARRKALASAAEHLGGE